MSAQRSQEIHGTVRISDARAHALTVKTKGNEERGALFLESTSLDTEWELTSGGNAHKYILPILRALSK